jgi:hypothetical protein
MGGAYFAFSYFFREGLANIIYYGEYNQLPIIQGALQQLWVD